MSADDQRSTVSRLLSVVVIVVAGLWAPQSMAQQWGATPQEQAMCRQMIPRPVNPSPDWGHMHHFCDCIRFRHRAMASMGDRNRFKFNITEAIGGCDYVLRKASSGFAMRPHIHVEKGRALLLGGDKLAAEQEFRRALQMNPAVVPAYVELAQLLHATGRASDALDILGRGLRHNPKNRQLQKTYLDMGGKEPFPEPLQSSKPASGLPTVTTVLPENDADDQKVVPDVSTRVIVDEPTTSASDAGAQEPDSSCRFCPPDSILERWRRSFSGED